jgi:hypothetical protein
LTGNRGLSADSASQNPQYADVPDEKVARGFYDKFYKDKISFEDFSTKIGLAGPEYDIESMKEIGYAPELNEMSMSAFKTSLGLLMTGDEAKAQKIIKENIPSAEFDKDAQGNIVVKFESGEYALNKPGISPQDVARFGFDIAAFTPAGRAATIPLAGMGAGATELGKQVAAGQAGGGDVDVSEVAGATVLGGAAKGLEELASGAVRAFKGRPSEAAEQIIETGREMDVPVMTTDVVPPESVSGRLAQQAVEKVPFVGTGTARGAQETARQSRGVTASAEDIVSSLQSTANKMKNAAGKRIAGYRETIGEVDYSKTAQAIDDAVTELSQPGRIKSPETIEALTNLKATMDEAPQTFDSLMANRTAFRDVIQSMTPAERSQLPTFAKAQAEKVYRGMTDDLDDAVRQSFGEGELRRWKQANEVYAQEGQKLTKSRLKAVLDRGGMVPENVLGMLFSSKPSETRSLYRSLSVDGKQAARGAIIRRALDKAGDEMSVAKFTSELDRLGENVDVFFKGADQKKIKGIKELLKATKRAKDGAGVMHDPVAGGAALVTAGMLGRLYESPAMRSVLVRLANNKPRSTAYDTALREAMEFMQSTAQAARDEDIAP